MLLHVFVFLVLFSMDDNVLAYKSMPLYNSIELRPGTCNGSREFYCLD